MADGTTRVTTERDPVPRYVSHGRGAYLYDTDGREFLDLNGNFTTLIHGHAFEPVISALERQLRDGTCFANPTEKEIELATLICGRVPGLERIRFCNTGTEAVLFAVKAARAFTGRPAIAKIEGAYHGAYDWAEVSQASTPASWGDPGEPNAVPNYRGTPASVLHDVVTLRFNEVEGTERLLRKHAGRLAAIVLDPMPSRAGLIPPDPDFISCVQRIAREENILVISDEVLNFRQSYEGAAARYGLEPDLYALGKIIGGGLPIGAVGGRAEVMAVFDATATCASAGWHLFSKSDVDGGGPGSDDGTRSRGLREAWAVGAGPAQPSARDHRTLPGSLQHHGCGVSFSYSPQARQAS